MSETLHMTFEGFGELFEGEGEAPADTGATLHFFVYELLIKT